MKLEDIKKGVKVESGSGMDYVRGTVVSVDGIFVNVEVFECGKRKIERIVYLDLSSVA